MQCQHSLRTCICVSCAFGSFSCRYEFGSPSENSRPSSAMKDRYWSCTLAIRCGLFARSSPAAGAGHFQLCVIAGKEVLQWQWPHFSMQSDLARPLHIRDSQNLQGLHISA